MIKLRQRHSNRKDVSFLNGARKQYCYWLTLSSVILCVVALIIIIDYEWVTLLRHYSSQRIHSKVNKDYNSGTTAFSWIIETFYNQDTDFQNNLGVHVPYWENIKDGINKGDNYSSSFQGPCYPSVHWNKEMGGSWRQQNKGNIHMLTYPEKHLFLLKNNSNNSIYDGLCRPGFLIIGAGKCGTSSLYHYLTLHDRVAPAKRKQVGYFKYFKNLGLPWYLHHFPTSTSFYHNSKLITGEAFPGYMPYPTEIAMDIYNALPGVRILVILREPIERAYSSYMYNYVQPAQRQHQQNQLMILPNSSKTNELLLFSFEEMIEAELTLLKECLGPTNNDNEKVTDVELCYYFNQQREDETDMTSAKAIPKAAKQHQWVHLNTTNPQKLQHLLQMPNMHLIQSLLGRGLYVLSLHLWYDIFSNKNNIYTICLEDLSASTKAVENVTAFLGLPFFDYTEIIQKGHYNVRGNEGFDTVSSLPSTKEKDFFLSPSLLQEVIDFYNPYNEQLFQLIGKNCSWNT